MSGISTHVLDVAQGRPAAGIQVRLERNTAHHWTLVARGITNADGRCRDLPGWSPIEALEYRLIFATGAYFERQNVRALYPEISVSFLVRDPGEHHHIPLLLAPNSYTTYRGS